MRSSRSSARPVVDPRSLRASQRFRSALIAFLALYLAALGASHVHRARTRCSPSDVDPQVESQQLVGTQPPVSIAFRRWQTEGTGHRRPWVLLHGSPGSSGDFNRLAEALATERPVLALDLPGFGASSCEVPDYSIRAHALYVEAWLDQLGIDAAHVLGFSMGGGVAIELAERAPTRVASVTLLSSIGAQEYELLGSYGLNHLVHAAQLGTLRLLSALLPHFGSLDRLPINVAYARNFYDTDQRPLRSYLERYAEPMLIVHGREDSLVPAAAAEEHHRIVPQSELLMLDAGHFMAFRPPPELTDAVSAFALAVDKTTATTRAQATPMRLRAAAQPFNPATLPRASGMASLVWGTLLALATLVSEDLTSISAGLLVAQGRIGFLAACLACAAGIFSGDLALFLAGRWLGRPWLVRRPWRWFLTPERIDAASTWLDRRGAAVILLSRFTPGLRLPTYFAAGVLRTSLTRFALYFLLAVAVWTPLIVGGAALLGDQFIKRFTGFAAATIVPLVAVALTLLLGLRLMRMLLTHAGRRRLAGAVVRATRWEFWPPWIFYPPVICWILVLGLRYRSPTLFTATNPGFPAGGFAGESKTDILALLPAASVARYERLTATLDLDQQRQSVRDFQSQSQDPFPVVIKPDVGERATGVAILRSDNEVDTYLAAATDDLLVQQYVPGPELGVFYVRRPNEARGRIFSITDKQLPTIVGDGHSTIAELIRADKRANVLAKTYLAYSQNDPERVLATGVEHRLVEVGAHCKGAVFVDGDRFHSQALETAIDAIATQVPGFFFGRFDLRAPSERHLLEARELKILELNGVTSEATHIYDPSMSLLAAYRVLFRQWALAFEIGRLNRGLGAPTTSIPQLAKMIQQHFTRRARRAQTPSLPLGTQSDC